MIHKVFSSPTSFDTLSKFILVRYETYNKSDLTVRLGDWKRNEYDESEQSFDIDRIIVHDNFTYTHKRIPKNDIALIKLDRPVR